MTLLTDGSLGRLRELLTQTDGMEEREGRLSVTHLDSSAYINVICVSADILKSVSAHYTMTCRHLGEWQFNASCVYNLSITISEPGRGIFIFMKVLTCLNVCVLSKDVFSMAVDKIFL